jgi:hypothetical protein
MEFFNNNQNKLLAAIPFGLGLLFVAIFYWKNYKISRATTESKF